MKAVFLTGASSGLGFVTAKELLKKGYFVILHYYKKKEKVEKLHNKYPENSILIQGDISKETEVLKMKSELEHQKIEVDILINNAAIEHTSDIEEKNENTFWNVLALNLLGPFYMIKHFGEEIEKKHGNILNISSDNAIDSYDVVTMEYDISKSGLNLMTKSFSNFFQNAKVNAICFGWLDTPMNDFPKDIKEKLNFFPLEEAAKKIIEWIETEETGKIELVR